MTVSSLAFYSLFLSKRPMYYNFFRKKHKHVMINHFKRGAAIFGLFTTWLVGLNLMFAKQVPHEVYKNGLFHK